MIDPKKSKWTKMTFCRPALSRENISTEENVLVSRVVFEGKRAVGVEYCDR